MPVSLLIDTPGGANFNGHDLRNVGRLSVGIPGLPLAGYSFQLLGDMHIGGNIRTSGFIGMNTHAAAGAVQLYMGVIVNGVAYRIPLHAET